MSTLIEAGTEPGLTAWRTPFRATQPEPGKVVAVAGDAGRVAEVLRLKAADAWTGYGSPTADAFLAIADTVEPWMVPVSSGDEEWIQLTAAEMAEFAA